MSRQALKPFRFIQAKSPAPTQPLRSLVMELNSGFRDHQDHQATRQSVVMFQSLSRHKPLPNQALILNFGQGIASSDYSDAPPGTVPSNVGDPIYTSSVCALRAKQLCLSADECRSPNPAERRRGVERHLHVF